MTTKNSALGKRLTAAERWDQWCRAAYGLSGDEASAAHPAACWENELRELRVTGRCGLHEVLLRSLS